MKKIIICFSMFMLMFLGSANDVSMCCQIILQVKITDPSKPYNPIGRTSVAIPTIYIMGCDLHFEAQCDDCTLQIVNKDGNVEYSTVIPANTTSLTLPSYLSGEYELQIIRGQFCFYGNIEL